MCEFSKISYEVSICGTLQEGTVHECMCICLCMCVCFRLNRRSVWWAVGCPARGLLSSNDNLWFGERTPGPQRSFWEAASGFRLPVPSQIRPLPSLSNREIFGPYSTQFTLAHAYRPDFYMHSSNVPASPPLPPIAWKKDMSNKSIKLAAYLYFPLKASIRDPIREHGLICLLCLIRVLLIYSGRVRIT